MKKDIKNIHEKCDRGHEERSDWRHVCTSMKRVYRIWWKKCRSMKSQGSNESEKKWVGDVYNSMKKCVRYIKKKKNV